MSNAERFEVELRAILADELPEDHPRFVELAPQNLRAEAGSKGGRESHHHIGSVDVFNHPAPLEQLVNLVNDDGRIGQYLL